MKVTIDLDNVTHEDVKKAIVGALETGLGQTVAAIISEKLVIKTLKEVIREKLDKDYS